MKSYIYGENVGYTTLLTTSTFQTFAYTGLLVVMLFTNEAYDYAKSRELMSKVDGTSFHIRFIRLYFFLLWVLNALSTYLLVNAYDAAARPVALVFTAFHIAVLAVERNPHEVPIHSLLGSAFFLGGIFAKV